MAVQDALRSRALSPRQELWTGIDVSITYGPLVLPAVDALRRAAAVLAASLPVLHLDDHLDVPAGRWRPLGRGPEAAGADAVVAWDGPDPSQTGVEEHARAVQRLRPAHVPLRFVVAGGYVTVLNNHAVGDAVVAVGALEALLEVAAGRGLPGWAQADDHRAPLRSALRSTYLRHPRQVLATARSLRPFPAVGPTASTASTGHQRPVAPAPDFVHRRLSAAALSRVKAWKQQHAPRAVTTALHAVVVGEALTEIGLPPLGGPTVLFDARRYLPGGAVVHGNFVAGLPVGLTGPWTVDGISQDVRAALSAARPLSAMAAGASGAMATRFVERSLGRVRPGTAGRTLTSGVWSAPQRPRPLLAVSSIRMPAIDRLPWAVAPDQCCTAALLTSAPATGMTAAVVEERKCLDLSLSFHGSVFDRDAVQAAVELVAQDPVRLLERSQDRRHP